MTSVNLQIKVCYQIYHCPQDLLLALSHESKDQICCCYQSVDMTA